MKKRKIRRNKQKVQKTHADTVFSYKNASLLKRCITEQGSILAREETGLSQKRQRLLAREIKRARHLALLPFTQVL